MAVKREDGFMTPAQFRALRKTIGVSQETLSRKLGVCSSTIQKIEAGYHRRNVPNAYAVALCLMKENLQLREFVEDNHGPRRVKAIIGRGVASSLIQD